MIRQLSVHFGVLWSKHGHHNLLFYCVNTVKKYVNLQNAKRNSYVCRFSKYSLVHKCRKFKIVYTVQYE